MTSQDSNTNRSAAYRIGRSMLGTVPIMLASSLVVTANVTGPLFAADHVQPHQKKPGVSPDPTSTIDLSTFQGKRAAEPEVELTSATIETAAAPTTYTVKSGDTVSSIAGHYGLSTASVLALNGLSWKSTIFPGQTLHLTSAKVTATPVKATAATATSSASTYVIVRGDTLSAIASRHHVTTQALLTANGLSWSSIIYPGQKLSIPGTSAAAAKPVAQAAAPVKSTASTSASSYTIKSGDTLSSIAKAHNTTVDKLLTANHLSWTSTIYAGKRLTIPGTAAVAAAATGTTTAVSSAASGASIPASSLNEEQRENVRTIIKVGRSLGVSDYGIVIALAAAAQESSLYNLTSGDRDSIGLFQQRPSMGWGTRAQLLNTTYAARLFFGGSKNPNAGTTRGLLDISGWSRMTVTQAAQAVQVSAYPTAYAKWERSARTWLASL